MREGSMSFSLIVTLFLVFAVPSSYGGFCNDFILPQRDLAKGPQILHDAMPPTQASELILDALRQEKYFGKTKIQGLPCNVCKKVMQQIQKIADYEAIARRIAERICSCFGGTQFCHQLLETYWMIGLVHFVKYHMKPELICAEMHMCSTPYEVINVTKVAEDILNDYNGTIHHEILKPSTHHLKGNAKKTKIDWKDWKDNNNLIKVVHVTDVHIDLEYKVGSNAECSGYLCCRSDEGLSEGNGTKAGYWGHVGKCDMPAHTIEQFAKFVRREIRPDLVFLTGDLTPHDVWMQTEEKQKASITNVSSILANNLDLEKTKVYPSIGNHDTYPSDQFDYYDNTTAWVFDLFSQIAGEHFHDKEIAEQIKLHGGYSILDQKTGIRIISINSQYGDTCNFFRLGDPTDPANFLVWFRDELKNAEKNGEKVIIIGHIPPASQYMSPKWGLIYNAIIERYINLIIGQFFGHEHTDNFHVIPSFNDRQKSIGIAFATPSLTSNVNLNPSFRVFLLDKKTKKVVNFLNYRLNLTKWNELSHETLEFDEVYNFLDEYEMESMDPEDLNKLPAKIKSDENLLNKYISNVRTGNPKESDFSESSKEYELCKLDAATFADVLNCMTTFHKFDKALEIIQFVFLDTLAGPWKRLIKSEDKASTIVE